MPEMPQDQIDALGAWRFLSVQYGGSPQTVLKKITDLESDNKDLRDTNKVLKEAQLKDGQVVVLKADADDLAAYRAINAKPADLAKIVETGSTAQQELAAKQLRDSAVSFVKAAGLAEETVDILTAIPALQGAKFEVRKGKVKDPKTQQETDGEIAYVTLMGDGQSAMKFDEVKEKVPALKALRSAEPLANQPAPRSFVPQGGGNPPTPESTGDPLKDALERNRQRSSAPSALRPAAKQ